MSGTQVTGVGSLAHLDPEGAADFVLGTTTLPCPTLISDEPGPAGLPVAGLPSTWHEVEHFLRPLPAGLPVPADIHCRVDHDGPPVGPVTSSLMAGELSSHG